MRVLPSAGCGYRAAAAFQLSILYSLETTWLGVISWIFIFKSESN